MGHGILLVTLILSWTALLVGLYQRIFRMPKWFANPPSSFELIRKQSKGAKIFWIPVSTLFMISVCFALIFNWRLPLVRSHLIFAIISYGLAGILSGMYFVKEVIAFTKMTVDAPSSPELHGRVKLWLRLTTIRDILQFLTTGFITVAFLHS
jgi:hypothetical protein